MRKIQIIGLLLLIILTACKESVKNPQIQNEYPSLFPDYVEVTIPSNIAPLNFMLENDYDKIDVVISDRKGNTIHVQGEDYIDIPMKKWKNLLSDNVGQEIEFLVSAKVGDVWKQFQPFEIHISVEPIDYGIAYRRIAPSYDVYGKMGIYQRDLSTFKERPIIENTFISGSCVNCHSFNQTKSDRMSLHIRGEYGGTLLSNGDSFDILNTKTDKTIGSCVYPYWHPSGKYIAYSTNQTHQIFHAGGTDKRIEVFDMESDVVVYDIENNVILTSDLLSTKDFETSPSFSPDGKTLYFACASQTKMPAEYRDTRYNLCSIAFDPETGKFGNKCDTLVVADILGKSITFPKPSFDGRYIMYGWADYGNFSIWHDEADLHLLDIKTGKTCALDGVNSNKAESYHNWSSNSRWFVVASRRVDGLYSHPFIASIDENGHTGKPFIVPQKDPRHYKTSFFSYNVPEFISAPVSVNSNKVADSLLSSERKQVGFKKQ
ncbi:hypothetical protein LJB98_04350 [Bacteroidales bacterium OttesenSCG-928-M11]|nr:hypothetical protein [Bacteroidales bacterium OttesenSCG-928-M11]